MPKKPDEQLPMLALEGGSLAPATVSSVFTPQLREALETAADAAEAVAKVRRSRRMLQDAMQALPHMTRLTAPMDRNEVYRRLQPLILLYGPPKLDGAEVGDAAAGLANAWLDVWTRALRSMTPEALDLAVDRWTQQSKWWPQPSELIKLGQAVSLEQHKLAYRLRKVCEDVPRTTKVENSPEENAKFADILADFRSKRTTGAHVMPEAYVQRSAGAPLSPAALEMIQAGLRRDQA